ncbi:MAG: succinate dehydrogenase, cytochrome b556 subunit [Gammaproteobacteria bacterium]
MAAHHNRPLSPHLQVYRLPFTGILSITHRITGVLLSAGLIAIVYLLFALADGPGAYAAMQTLLNLGSVQVLLWGFILALFLHFCHGVRHLVWDVGSTFEAEQLNRYAVIELLASILLTVLTFFWMG